MGANNQSAEVQIMSTNDKSTVCKSLHTTVNLMETLTGVIEVSRTHLHTVMCELSENNGDEKQIESLYEAIQGSSKLDLVNKCHISTLQKLDGEVQSTNFTLDQFETRVKEFDTDFQNNITDTVTDHKVDSHEWTQESLAFLKEQFPHKYNVDVNSELESDEDIVVGPATQDFKCKITQMLMKDPMKNSVCGHRYSKAGIMQMIGEHPSIKCPIGGCGKTVRRNTLQHDPRFEKILKRFQRTMDSQQHEQSSNVETIE